MLHELWDTSELHVQGWVTVVERARDLLEFSQDFRAIARDSYCMFELG